jgi:hypothetical protein
MKSIAVFLLFVGSILVVQGYYSKVAETSCPPREVEIKYLPMSLYEEQLSDENKVSKQFKSLFEDVSTWPVVRN